ncbi:MAG TPA: IclR family transcriptional regulator [Ktedonobacteraceae bacterium]
MMLNSKSENLPGNSVQSVERTLDLLEYLARSTNWLGISELSSVTGLPVGTVHRLLATLVARGYVARDSHTRRYTLGPTLRMLANMNQQAPSWVEIAEPFLRELMELSGETANLAVLEREQSVYVAQAQSRRIVRMFTEVGNKVPLHNTGCGKVLLAYHFEHIPASVLAQMQAGGLTSMTITDPQQLQQELAEIRQRGYAVDNEEQEEGVRCLAVPVFGLQAKIIAAISVSGPASRLDMTRTETLVPHIKRISAALSQTLIAPQEN